VLEQAALGVGVLALQVPRRAPGRLELVVPVLVEAVVARVVDLPQQPVVQDLWRLCTRQSDHVNMFHFRRARQIPCRLTHRCSPGLCVCIMLH